MTATKLVSVVEDPTTYIDSGVAYAHVNWGDSWRTRRLGARDLFFSDDGYIQFDIKLDGRPKLRVIVKLEPADTYAVEIGRIRRCGGLPEYQVLAQERGHYTDSMGPAVERLAVKRWEGGREAAQAELDAGVVGRPVGTNHSATCRGGAGWMCRR